MNNGFDDGDEFVWEDEPAPPSDHETSHHYYLDMAAMRARDGYGKRKRRLVGAAEIPTASVPPEAA